MTMDSIIARITPMKKNHIRYVTISVDGHFYLLTSHTITTAHNLGFDCRRDFFFFFHSFQSLKTQKQVSAEDGTHKSF